MYSFGAVRGYAEMNRLPGCAAGAGWGMRMRSGRRAGDRAAGTRAGREASPRPRIPNPPRMANLAEHRQGLAGWGKHPCDAGENVCCVKPELRAISSSVCAVFAAAGIRGLIRVTNDDETCDLSESLGYNYVGQQVKESLLD